MAFCKPLKKQVLQFSTLSNNTDIQTLGAGAPGVYDIRLTLVYIMIYTKDERKVINMLTAKVFENGRSQAIRLPKECRFSSDEVLVNKIGDIVILLPKQNKWDSFMRAIDMFSDDFMADGRATDVAQEREEL